MHIQEAATTSSSSPPPPLPSLDGHFSRTLRTLGRPIRIYADNAQVTENLTRPEFVHVASPAEADVVWVRGWIDGMGVCVGVERQEDRKAATTIHLT